MNAPKFKVGDRVVFTYAVREVVDVIVDGEDEYVTARSIANDVAPVTLHARRFSFAPEAAGGPEDCPEGIVSYAPLTPTPYAVAHAAADRVTGSYATRFAGHYMPDDVWDIYTRQDAVRIGENADEAAVVLWVAGKKR